MSALQRINSLQLQIEHLHLSYLETDESPRKIEKRKKLEGYIREYLYLVPHDRKFCFEETKHVLRRSVESKESFSAYKASNAWSALAVYAENLLSQPWRKEFHQVKLYSGYYKHHIESGLVGAEVMLEKMGYKHSKDFSMVLDNVNNTARIISISKDCLIAMVECQILRTVYEEVIKKFPCSWLQVLEYRETYVCSPEQLAEALISGTISRNSDHAMPNHTLCCLYPSYKASYVDCMYNHHPQNYTYSYHYSPMQASVPTYSQPYCQANMVLKPHDMYPPNPPYTYSYAHPQIMMDYAHSNQTALPPNYSHLVPTAQLVELDPPQESYLCHRRSNSDHKIASQQRKSSERYSTDCSRSTPSDDLPIHGLKSKGLSNYVKTDGSVSSEWDFMDSGDLRNVPKSQSAAKSKSGYNSSSLDNLKLNGGSMPEDSKLGDSLGKLSVNSNTRLKAYENSDSTDSSQRLSGYGNASGFSPSSHPSVHSSNKLKTSLVTEVPSKPSKPYTSNNQVRNSSLLVDTSELVVNLNSDEWSCVNCTYLNKDSVKICEMCGKSKTSGSEMAPLISGGRECPQCTLVNEKDFSTCIACNSDLKDSSTYV